MDQNQASGISSTAQKSNSIPRQVSAILIASAVAILANVLLYYILKDLFGVPFIAPEQFPPPEVSPIPVTDVILFSVIFCAGAGLVFLVIANTVRRPAQIFAVISIIVLLASLYLPLRMPTPPIPLATKLALDSMHILGAAVLVPLLIRLGLPRQAGVGEATHSQLAER